MDRGKLEDNRKNRTKSPGLPSSNFNSYSNKKEYNSIPPDRFYTEKEEVTLRFYQTPKVLFKTLSTEDSLLAKSLCIQY